MNDFLSRLVQAETTPRTGELAAAQVISDELALSGIEARIDAWDGSRANVAARIKSSGQRPALLFACHLDVVGPGEAPWKHPPFKATAESTAVAPRI